MSYKSFYRNIVKRGDKYWIQHNSEYYIDCKTLAEALYERDRLMSVEWDWDLYLQLPNTPNGYIHIDLPPFDHSPTYITHIKEHWIVVSKGANPRYYGIYYTKEEANKVRMIYNGRIMHKKAKWKVQRKINHKTKYFGTYYTKEEAEERVKELEKKGWD